MRMLLARLWLLLPLLLLLQASGARSASACGSERPCEAYLPDDGARNFGDPLDERAAVESSDDDDGEQGREVAHHEAVTTAIGWARAQVPAATSHLVGVDSVLRTLRILRLSVSPLRGPPQRIFGNLLVRVRA